MGKIHRICSIENCDKKHLSRGWCAKHYRRWMLYGDPLKLHHRRQEKLDWLRETSLTASDECITWPWCHDGNGYGVVGMDGENRRVHRLMCEMVHGDPPSSAFIALHSCGNGHLGCCNPRHLRWGTFADNGADMVRHGRSTRGATNPQSKLSDNQIAEIKSLRGRLPQSTIAARFGVRQSAISRIQTGARWGSAH